MPDPNSHSHSNIDVDFYALSWLSIAIGEDLVVASRGNGEVRRTAYRKDCLFAVMVGSDLITLLILLAPY